MLWLALLLLALASPLVKWLIANGGNLGLRRPEAISFCNVLFVGNAAAGLVMFFSSGRSRLRRDFQGLDRGNWGRLAASVVLAAAIPSLLFTALETTMVTNVVLLGRFESVAYTILGAWFLGSRVSAAQWLGYGIIATGIVALVLVQSDFHLMTGDGLVLGAALLQAVAAVQSRRLLQSLSVRAFVFARNLFSSVLFFTLALWWYGWEHFSDAFAPELWVAMTAYAGLVIVLGQLAWYRALRELPPAQVSNWSMSTPFLAIAFACLLLGERPQLLQWVAAAIILIGMLVTRWRAPADRRPRVPVEQTLAGG